MVLWAQHFELGHVHLLTGPSGSRASKAGRWSSTRAPKTDRMERHASGFTDRMRPAPRSRKNRRPELDALAHDSYSCFASDPDRGEGLRELIGNGLCHCALLRRHKGAKPAGLL